MAYYDNRYSTPDKIDSSPGLEVGVPCSTLPEVVPNAGDSEKFVYGSDDTLAPRKQRRLTLTRNRILLGVAIAILVIVAVVVGTVVGVLKSKERSDASEQSEGSDSMHSPKNENTTDPSNQPSGPGIRDDSMLAVTGWRRQDDFSVRLFYQDKDGYIRILSLESNQPTWSAGKAIIKAKLGTPLAAATHNQSIYDPSKPVMNTHLFYINDKSILQQYVFEDGREEGTNGPINEMNVEVAKGSKLGSYWPSVTFQDPNNIISEMRFNCTAGETSKCWGQHSLDILAHPESPLAQVPRDTNFAGLQLYYQRESEKDLVNYAWVAKTGKWGSVHDYQRPLPPSAPVGVMATPRGNDTTANNLFVLYQDSDGSIQFSHRNEKGWKPPKTSSVFDEAKKGTNLACLNPSSWTNDGLKHAEDMNSCFYIGKQGIVRQVQWRKGGWKDDGDIRSTRAVEDEN